MERISRGNLDSRGGNERVYDSCPFSFETADRVIDLASLAARAPDRRTFYGVERSQNRASRLATVASSLRTIPSTKNKNYNITLTLK